MKGPITKAKAINRTKEKILFGGLALLAGIAAVAMISSSARAEEKTSTWSAHSQVNDETKVPFQLKTSKLNH